jgi:hypothetical protein
MAGTSPALTKKRVLFRLLEGIEKCSVHFRSGSQDDRLRAAVVMPGVAPGIHILAASGAKDVDSRYGQRSPAMTKGESRLTNKFRADAGRI